MRLFKKISKTDAMNLLKDNTCDRCTHYNYTSFGNTYDMKVSGIEGCTVRDKPTKNRTCQDFKLNLFVGGVPRPRGHMVPG